MQSYTANTCSVTTIEPMGVSCYPTNATDTQSYDGSISLIITGGTPPYTVEWNNGSNGIPINNLNYGSYTATVTDSYEDYVETITCEVGYDSFYLSRFQKCSDFDGPDYIYTTLISPLDYDTIYSFNVFGGCYQYWDNVLYSGQIYSALTISSTYTDCKECVPTTPPQPTQGNLCLTYNNTQYEFLPSGLDNNGYFTWSSSTTSFEINFNTDTLYWQINNWNTVNIGQMIFYNNVPIPLGGWTNVGNPNSITNLMVSGSCQGLPLSLEVKVTDEECKGEGNGSVILIGSNGTPPYSYRVTNIPPYPNYSNIGLFTNLSPGTYTAEIMDSYGIIQSSSFTINQGLPVTNIIANLTSNENSTNNFTKLIDFSLNTLGTLISTNSTISFDLVVEHNRSKRTNGIAQFTRTLSVYKNGTTIPSTSTPPASSSQNVCIDVDEESEGFYDQINSITLQGGDTFNGELTIQILPFDGGSANCQCPMIATYDVTIRIENLTIDSTAYGNCYELSITESVNHTLTLQECIVLT